MRLLKNIVLVTFISMIQVEACPEFHNEPNFYTEVSYNFLDPLLIDEEEDSPLYKLARFSTYGYGARVSYFSEKKQELNIEEWKKYFENRLTTKELNGLFYNGKHSFNELKSKINNKGFKRYLDFLEKQSTFVRTLDSKVDPQNLLDEAFKFFQVEDDEFLKLRYFFLALRIEHYLGHYDVMLKTYSEYASKLKHVDSIVWEWIEALRAGALQHVGKDVESNLLYGKILKNHKTNPYLGYYDFKVETDTQWKNLFSKLKTSEEKALFYFLRALKWKSAPLREHREISKIAPNSIWFERLSYMLMQEFQRNPYTVKFNLKKSSKYEIARHKIFLEKKTYFLKTLSMLKEATFFASYAELYVNVLSQSSPKQMLSKVEVLYSMANEEQMPYVIILEYMNTLNKIQNKNSKLFSKLDKLLNEAPVSKKEELSKYTAGYMKDLYAEGSATQYFSNIYSGSWMGVLEVIDTIGAKEFEDYIEKQNRSSYEKKIFKKTMKSLKKNDIARFLTILYTKEGDFQKANYYLEQVPQLNRKTEFNPFNVSLSGNNRKVKGKGYSQRKFVKTMLKIQNALEINPESAMDHYLFANGLYNSSWFGNFPMVSWISRYVRYFSEEEGKKILEKMDLAQKEYELALKYAKKKEFKAKISYQLLKVKFNKFLIEESNYEDFFAEYRSKNSLLENNNLEKAFEKYKRDYASSEYGRETINNCATFRYFK